MAAATIVVLGVWVATGRHAPAESEHIANLGDHRIRTTADISEVPLETTTGIPLEATPPEGSPPLELAEIRNLCPLFSGDFEDDCMHALDLRYLDRPATYYERPPIFGIRDYTWREVFEDPISNRAAVASALDRSECLVPEGDLAPRLHDACAAQAMATLSILHKACGQTLWQERLQGRHALDADLRQFYDVEIEVISPPSTDLIDYYRRRDVVDNRWIRVAWQAQKCRSLPSAALDWLPHFPVPRGHRADFDQNRPLRAAAARLGNEWAMAFHGGSRKDLDALGRIRPDLAYAKRARVVGQNSAKYLPYLTLAKDYALRRGLPLDEVESSLGLDRFSQEELERAAKRAVEIRLGDSVRQ